MRFVGAMRATRTGYQPVLPAGEFKASWHPSLRISLIARALDLLMWPSPLLFLLAITIVRVRVVDDA